MLYFHFYTSLYHLVLRYLSSANIVVTLKRQKATNMHSLPSSRMVTRS